MFRAPITGSGRPASVLRTLVAPLLLACPLVHSSPAHAQESMRAEIPLRLTNVELARALRVDPTPGFAHDTVWVGRSTAAGVTNPWSVGPGPNRPAPATTGRWDFDVPVNGDSLQGWWPIRMLHTDAAGAVLPDTQRPWWAVELGNQADYVIDQGAKRTFGVVGVWHRDPGSAVPGPAGSGTGVAWAPLGGAYSAWMGLRQHGDTAVLDPITGNAFDAGVLQFSGTGGPLPTRKAFPGYGSQMDQMLYRDVDITGVAGPITLTFTYATAMSTRKVTDAATRTGWFEGDPLSVNGTTPGNFISAEAGVPANALAPVDSFQVYVGRPVEGTWVASDGLTRPVYDPLRRWFNEVLAKDVRRWLFGAAGEHAAATRSVVVSAADVAAFQAGGAHTLRIVFRVHTNRGFDDESGPDVYTSRGRGAAQVDDIVIDLGSGPVTIGDFEAAGSIDNTVPPSVAWHSTGKPPAVHFHAMDLNDLAWNDICGGVASPLRTCDMRGGVMSMGDFDQGEATGGALGTSEANGVWGAMSPTVGLVATSGVPNSFGLTLEQATATGGYAIAYDLYTGVFDALNAGCTWQFMAQCYPAPQPAGGPAAGTPSWGEIRVPSFLYYDPLVQCATLLDDLSGSGLVLSANGAGLARPDSLRIGLRLVQTCYRFGVTIACSPTGGAYADGISLAIIDGPPHRLSADIWDWFQDTFPFNETAGLPATPAFDTTSALIRSGLNIAQTTGNLQAFDVPGDSIVVCAPGEDVRVDLVFRIKPGVGNYITVGNPASGLRAVPTSPAPASADPNSFWMQFRTVPGDFATPGASTLDASWPGGWNPHVWRSARCDTAQLGLFPVGGAGVGPALDPMRWMSTYHESDPHFAALGIPRRLCFLVDTLGPANSTNITCGTVPPWVLADPARAGYDGNPISVEGTHILPDGQFTPGTHVQYFWRRSAASAPGTMLAMCPDTNIVYPQPAEASLDAHRWQQFGVLPDRWKDAFFGGEGMACMLVVDVGDRRGEELAWVSVCDTSGATSTYKYGAHNGWHAPGGVDVNTPTYFISSNGGQPGTTWDMFGVKAGEDWHARAGGMGSRLAFRDPSPANLVDGKYARNAPTPEMLETFYKLVVLHTGDLSRAVLGPLNDTSSDELGYLTTFLQGATLGAPRGIEIYGDGFAEATATDAFVTDVLGMDLYYPSYLELSGNSALMTALILGPDIAGSISSLTVRNTCTRTLDIVVLNPAVREAVVGTEYAPVGGAHFIASVLKTAVPERPWISIAHGFALSRVANRDIPRLTGRCVLETAISRSQFSSFCQAHYCSYRWFCGGAVDDPRAPLADGLRLFNSPLAHGDATLEFTLAAPDRVSVGLYDVGGRLVRSFAERAFPAGVQRLAWDGVDDSGRRLNAGVYFARVRYATRGFEGVKKVIVLK